VLSANAGSLITSEYDKYFKESAIFLPLGSDWRLLKAQLYAESNLNPTAVSPVGARGIAQFMPDTANELIEDYPELTDFYLPENSIRAASIYMNKLNKFWSSPRPVMDRWLLATASYNAGAGNIHKAQKKCDNKSLYLEIIKCLPQITGRHSKETINYNKRILKFYWVILLG
jgi:membrane-bound lytic murein transglycosylase F